ncbi:MAG: hypothetical protein E6G14_08455 [Actinobacteria bacterium]|nr:MAG: hypothetical protein E6G14_08455 [Actinomycetota bacterium]
MSGRATLLVALGIALVAGAAAAVVVLVAGTGKASVTPEQYLAEASAVCKVYARKLDRVPPPDPGSTADVAASVGRALPILEGQAAAVRKIRPPHALEDQVHAFFARTDRSLGALRAVLEAAKRGDAKAMGPKLGVWFEASDAAQTASHRVGYKC